MLSYWRSTTYSLLKCWNYGLTHNIKWNSSKTKIIRLCSSSKKQGFSQLSFPEQPALEEVTSEKWLGYTLTANMKDDDHLRAQARRLYCATHQILAGLNPFYLDENTKRKLVNAYGNIYLIGCMNNYSKKSMSYLQRAHRYLTVKITLMKDRNKFLWNQDPEINGNELYGVKQLFETGGLYPDTRSRWVYTRYRLKSIGELQRYSAYRIKNVVLSLQACGLTANTHTAYHH